MGEVSYSLSYALQKLHYYQFNLKAYENGFYHVKVFF